MGRYGNEIVEAGMVGAFEPLVYIPGRFGMQNKDMFCVTDKGCELLSDVTPTDTLLRWVRLERCPSGGQGIRSNENHQDRNDSDPVADPPRASVGESDHADRRVRHYQALHRRRLDRPRRSAGVKRLGRRSRQIFRRDAADDDAYHQRYSRAGVVRARIPAVSNRFTR